MKTDLAANWEQRLALLQAQINAASDDARVWHWRAEERVLRFLVRRYGAGASVGEIAESQPSALERALLKMALLIPNSQTKHPRPTARDRTEILSRIQSAGDEARDISDEEWCEIKRYELASYRSFQMRQKDERRREQIKEWMRDLRERK